VYKQPLWLKEKAVPKLMSGHWDEEVGACMKHGVPTTPCPACLAEKDQSTQVILTKQDHAALDWEPDLKVAEFFAPDEQWLMERIVY
jgi:hypothetical protein